MAEKRVHSHCHVGGVDPVVVGVLPPVPSLNNAQEFVHLSLIDLHCRENVVLLEDPEAEGGQRPSVGQSVQP